MHRVFNCGIGMVVVVAAQDAEGASALLRQAGETAWRIGTIRARRPGEAQTVVGCDRSDSSRASSGLPALRMVQASRRRSMA